MFKLLKIKTNQIGSTALVMTIFTLSSNLLAVVRDKIFSTTFGAGEILDIYYASFKIPDILFLTTGSLISAFVLIPFFNKEEKKSFENLKLFIEKTFFTFSSIIIVLALLVFALMPYIAPKIFTGFNAEQIEKLVLFSRIILLSPFFMGIANIFIAQNQRQNLFIPMAITGVFYNISIILSVLFLYPIFGFFGVIFGVVFGASLYFLLQLPSIIEQKLLPQKVSFFNFKELKTILKLSVPRSVALAVADLILVFLIAMATNYGEGVVTLFTFAINIFLVPIGIIAISYSIAVFPKLSLKFTENKIDDFKEMVRDVNSRILFFGFPVSFYFLFFSVPVVGFLLGSEKFGFVQINTTAFIVSVMSFAILFKALTVMTVRVFYAMGKTYLPLLANLSVVFFLFSIFYFIFPALNLDFLYSFIKDIPFENQYQNITKLAVSYSLAVILGTFVTIYFFKKSTTDFSLFKNTMLIKKFFISLFSALGSKIVFDLVAIPKENSFLTFFLELMLSGIVFVLIFIILSEILKDKNYLEFKTKFLKIIKKKLF